MKKLKTLKTLADLKEHALISEKELPSLQQVAAKFNLLITPTMVNLMTKSGNNDPIAKQFLPSFEELTETDKELSDPIGDSKYEKVKGVVHRYPDRCLLKVVSVCPVYCRFCFRKEMIGPGNQSLTKDELKIAYDYIKSQNDIWEVILTGGDPFILKAQRMGKILSSLAKIEHVEVVRIHTRVPVVDPLRITAELIDAMKIPKAVYVVLHANHPDEFTAQAIESCARIVDAGIPMLSQTVLLKGINDDPKILSQLMKTFVRHRIKPYYLHHPDLAKGTGHFRVTIEDGQQLMKSLQGTISGLCQPTYMLEIPGGAGKIPVGPCYIHKEDERWVIEDYLGVEHFYL